MGMPEGRAPRRSVLGLGIAAGAVLALAALGSAAAAPARLESGQRPASLSAEARQQVLEQYGELPLAFVPNSGQADAKVRLSAQGPGFSFAFLRGEALFAFTKTTKEETQGAAIALRFLGARPDVEPQGRRPRPGRVNYLLGNDPAKWQTNLPTYGQVVYRNVWPGIDVRFRGAEGQLKYEFLLRPGAEVGDIRLAYRGAERLSLDRRGNLLIETPLGRLTDMRPFAYQQRGGERVPVSSRYLLPQGERYGIAVGAYDRGRPLVIDPGLLYSTYLGAGNDGGQGIAVDGAGNAYVTGLTNSTNFPTTPGAFDTIFNSIGDAFVTKLNPTGSALVYSTYLGGSGLDQGFGIAVDGLGNAYVTGATQSTNFPTMPGAFDMTANGFDDAFVTKLNPTGSALVYSTYLGAGNGSEQGFGIAVDGGGNAYVTGVASLGFPTTPGAFDTIFNGGVDAFVTKLNPAGSAPLVYSTYLGGLGEDRGHGIAIDGAGNAYVTGRTLLTNPQSFPTTAGAFDTTANGGLYDAFVTKLNPTGGAPLVYSTYLGGADRDEGNGIAVDGAGKAYVTGLTRSMDFPASEGAFDTTANSGLDDAFVTTLNPTGGAPLVYSTYLGGSGSDQGFGIAVDGGGNAHVTGLTSSTNFPTTPAGFDTTANGFDDAFMTKLNPTGSAPLVYSTYLGGGGLDRGFGIAVDGAGSAYVTGSTTSSNFPTTPGAFDTTFNNNDAFVTKLDIVGAPTTLMLTPVAATNPVGTSHTVTATVRDAGNNPVSGVTVRFSVTGTHTASGSATTNASGQATFTYPGTAVGPDAIHAFADTDTDTTQDVGEPFGDATKAWTPAAPATLTLAPAADANTAGEEHCVTATVEDAFGNPTPGITVRFSVTGANSASGSDTTDANGEATFCYTGTAAGADAIHAYVDTDADSTQDVGEPFGDATKAWAPAAPATLTLEPAADANTIGEEHCVTATVRDAFGNPVPGVTIRFSVTPATFPSPASGSVVTDANGKATFCYSASLPGEDAIHAFADTDGDEMQDLGEPSGVATKTWTLPASTAFCEVTITEGGWIIANNGDRATLSGNARVSADGSVQGKEKYTDHGPAQPMDVDSIELTAATCSEDRQFATIHGTATIDGQGMFIFRIDVTDMGSSGANDSYGIILSNGYVSGQHPLGGGNVNIRTA
jgi:hypothetical protein